MAQKFVKNDAVFIGQIFKIFQTDKVTILTIETENEKNSSFNYRPHIYCFGNAKKIVDTHYKEGDYARFNCLVQSNPESRKYNSVPSHTVVLFNISKINRDNPNYKSVNRFALFGRIVAVRKTTDNAAVATVFIYTTRANYFKISFVSDNPEDVDNFCMLQPDEPVWLYGKVTTNRIKDSDGNVRYFENCVVTKFNKINKK